MNKLRSTIFVTILCTVSVFAQEYEKNAEFKPSGKPFATVFSNFHMTNEDGENSYAFDLTRAYLGYGYTFSENFSGKINIDVGTPEVNIGDSLEGETNLELTVYLKNASLSYTYENLAVDFGLIVLKQFEIQEKLWGHRYLYKSFQDAYKFGPSADLGISVSYQFIDMLSADITVMNGEGYKSLQADSLFKYGVGITGKPLKGLIVRVYYDMMGTEDIQSSLATFIGYQDDKISGGVEYNMQMNNKMKDGYDFSGLSVFGSYQATKMIEGFARYDNLGSVKVAGADDPWNSKKDGQLIIAGVEFTLAKGVKIAPNYQGWIPEQSGADFISSVFLNIGLKF